MGCLASSEPSLLLHGVLATLLTHLTLLICASAIFRRLPSSSDAFGLLPLAIFGLLHLPWLSQASQPLLFTSDTFPIPTSHWGLLPPATLPKIVVIYNYIMCSCLPSLNHPGTSVSLPGTLVCFHWLLVCFPGFLGIHNLFQGFCEVRAEVLQERVPKCRKAGQRDTSECSWEPDMCGTEGLASAQRLRPHGMPMLYSWLRPMRLSAIKFTGARGQACTSRNSTGGLGWCQTPRCSAVHVSFANSQRPLLRSWQVYYTHSQSQSNLGTP